MRFSRLFVLSLVFTGSALSAQAQYTSRSPAPTETAAQKTQTTAAAPTTRTNPYTGTGAATAAQAAKPQQPAQPVFRPRPQPAAMPQAGDDELPSFDALEKPAAAAQGSAQGSNLPPPPPPKGEIWFYMAEASYENPTGYKMSCDWKIVLQNKTDTPIKELKITYTLLGSNYPLRFRNIAPNASKVWDQGTYSEKCPAMVQTKPKVNIISCKLGTATGQDCSKYIVVK